MATGVESLSRIAKEIHKNYGASVTYVISKSLWSLPSNRVAQQIIRESKPDIVFVLQLRKRKFSIMYSKRAETIVSKSLDEKICDTLDDLLNSTSYENALSLITAAYIPIFEKIQKIVANDNIGP